MPMYEKKVKRITGTATSKPAAKKPAMPAKPSANMAKMNKSAATGKPKPSEITKGQQVRKQPAKKIIKKGMM
jgi:hypothetical protein